jgi:hypothetical protein
MVIGIVGSGPLSQETRIGSNAASSGDGDMAWFTDAENRLHPCAHTNVPLPVTNLNEALRECHVFRTGFL